MSTPDFAAIDARLQRVQGASGLVFGAFLAQHLVTNSVISLMGASDYNHFVTLARAVYQHPMVEVGILGSIVVHLGASVGRWVCQRKFRAQQPKATVAAAAAVKARHAAASEAGLPPSVLPTFLRTRDGLHRASGYYLATFIAGHVIATRVPKLPSHMFEFVAFPVWRLQYFFVPYYGLLAASGAAHLLIGAPRAARTATGGRLQPKPVPVRVVQVLAVAAGIGALVGLRLLPSRETILNLPGPIADRAAVLDAVATKIGF